MAHEQYYADMEMRNGYEPSAGAETSPVELRVATTEEDVLDLIEDGYVSVGCSSFTGPYTPMSLAVDTAERHGASLALLDIRYERTKQYTSVMFLPSYSSSYSWGSVSTAHGRGTYSGTTTSTALNAVPVQREVEIYSHDAMFFRKIDTSRLYGVHLFVPRRLPTEKPDAPIRVRVMAVFHGTRAERDGIKRGQVVKSINGKDIRTRSDIAPFVNNPEIVERVEVADAE